MTKKIVPLISVFIFLFALLVSASAQTMDQAALSSGAAPTVAPQQPSVTQLTSAPLAAASPATGTAKQTLAAASLSSIEQMFAGMAAGLGTPAQSLLQFGYSLFDTPSAPSLAAIGDDYVLGPGDGLVLYLWGDAVDIKELSPSYTLTVDRNGAIFLPPVGQVSVWGQDLGTIRGISKGMLDRRYKRLEMNLTLGTLRQFPVFVSGYAGSPGTVLANGADTVLTVLFRAGGILKTGSLRSVVLTRQGKGSAAERIEIDFYASLLQGKPIDLRVREGDSIFIPGIGPVVALSGELKRPGIYEIKNEATLAQTLALAGGALPSARSGTVTLLRFGEAGKTLSMGDITDKTFAGKPAMDGDFVYFGKVSDLLLGQAQVTGAVKYPGRYDIASFGSLRALLQKAQLLPETNQYYGRVYRMDQSGRDRSFAFSPRDVLADNARAGEGTGAGSGAGAGTNADADVPLFEFDRIVLYRYDDTGIDPNFDRFENTLVMTGPVKYPGFYLYKDGMTLSQVLTKDQLLLDTNQNYGEITRLRSDGKNEYVTFRPGEVVAGKFDLSLGPRDVIRLVKVGYSPAKPDFDRFMAAVQLEGPVEFGGLYAWREGMRLSELLKLAKPRLETNEVYAEIVRPLGGGKNEYVTFAPREVAAGVFDLALKARDTVKLYTTTAPKVTTTVLGTTEGQIVQPGVGSEVAPAGTASVQAVTAGAAVAQGTAAAASPAAGAPAMAAPGAATGAVSGAIETDTGFYLEVVFTSGSVRYQGPYARTPTLMLSSVVTPDQILQDTSLDYAELTRRKPDGSWEYRTFAPRDVLNGSFDLKLRAMDSIRFVPVKYLPEKFDFDKFGNAIAIVGAANFPGLYSFSNYRMLSELLTPDQLLSTTDIYYAEIERWISSGRTEYLTFSPLAVLQGKQDLQIYPRDIIRFVPEGDKGENHDFSKYPDTVLLKGVIRYPSRYAWYKGLKLSDIIQESDLLIDTETSYAEIKRYSLKADSIISFAPAQVIAKKTDIELMPRDIVNFYPKYANKPISIAGEVANPKIIPYYDQMELSSVIRSVTLSQDMMNLKAEIKKTTGETMEVFLEDYLKRQPGSKIFISPGDAITIRALLPDEHLPIIVVRGEVKDPQSLPFAEGMRLADALEAAGGYDSTAYPKGLVLIRKSVANAQQTQLDRLIAQLDAATAAGTNLPNPSDTSLNSASAVIANMQIDLAVQKAKLGNLKQLYKEGFGRISLEIPASLEELRSSPSNIRLERDDLIYVPKVPTFVLVSGEVSSQNAVLYREGMTVRQAIVESGWLSNEADLSHAYIIRASGKLDSTEGKGFLWFKPNILNYKLEPGDTVFVPTKSAKVSVAWAYLRDSFMIISSLLTSALTAKTLLGL